MIKNICVILLVSVTIFSCEQTKPEKERINSVCDKFMQNFKEGKISDALQLLKQYSIIPSESIDSLGGTITKQMDRIFPSYGKMLSYEFINERRIKDFIAKRFYILKFEEYYLKFDFTLYNNGTRWTITNFNYDESLIEILY